MSTTTIRWEYRPVTLFESPLELPTQGARLLIGDGAAIATINPVVEPVPAEVLVALEARVRRSVAARALLTHQVHELSAPAISYERDDGSRSVTLTVGASSVLVVAGTVDIVQRDAAGNVLHDSKAERIAAHDRATMTIMEALERHAELEVLVASYLRAAADPADEFVHLYDVRDALAKLLGGETGARTFLGISKGEWQQLGRLANDEPIDQGRHRGKHLGSTRPATAAELKTARATVRSWLLRLCERWQA